MTHTELVLNMLAEVAATDISIERQPAKVSREQIEKSIGKLAINSLNAKSGMAIGKRENKRL